MLCREGMGKAEILFQRGSGYTLREIYCFLIDPHHLRDLQKLRGICNMSSKHNYGTFFYATLYLISSESFNYRYKTH